MNNDRRVATVLRSYYFHPYAEVLVTECGHRHVRPTGAYRSGDMIACPFCEEHETFPIDPKAPVMPSSSDDES